MWKDVRIVGTAFILNPVANLISVPIQSNWDFRIGSANAMRYTLNVQPVIPFSLNAEWNLIARTIIPIIHAESPVEGGSDAGGLGDIVQSFFLSPSAPTSGGWIWGTGGFVKISPDLSLAKRGHLTACRTSERRPEDTGQRLGLVERPE